MGLEELKPEETQLLALITEYRQIMYDMGADCHELDEELEGIQKERNERAKPYQEKLAILEIQMRLPMLDYQHTFKCSAGSINYRKGAVRRTWNLDALDQICTAKPEVKNEIWAFRKETIGEPSITVNIIP